ncbi:hypothetical protein H8356DRAFT_1335590 [Neocallimastix lanati (nom. inval.)]|nr:hypothetical protein H8356DRAFT_1335590 [Neocallimastix sp. JGI-2020a]
MTRVLSGIEPDPPLILCASEQTITCFTVLGVINLIVKVYQPKSCNVGLTPQPTSEGLRFKNKEVLYKTFLDLIKTNNNYDSKMTEGSLTGIQRDKYFQRVVDPRGKNFQKNKRSKRSKGFLNSVPGIQKIFSATDEIKILIENYKSKEINLFYNGCNRNELIKLWKECLIDLNDININLK